MHSKEETAFFETFPAEVKAYIMDAKVTVIKNKIRSSVYHIENQAYDIFLKVSPKEQMLREALMTEYLYRYGVCPGVRHYTSDENRDYLITERIIGSDAASDSYLGQPARLTELFAESLVVLHRLQHKYCPIVNGLEQMAVRAERNYREGRAEKGILRYLGYASVEKAYEDMVALYKNACAEQVIIHGDYCLPNVILHASQLSGYVDVGYGGVGDRHYDIFWGLWSLRFNTKKENFAKRFIEAYGKHLIDEERLRLCGLLSVFNGFRGQDYYE